MVFGDKIEKGLSRWNIFESFFLENQRKEWKKGNSKLVDEMV